MGDEAVVVQIIRQICDLREALAFHNDKSADHGFFGGPAVRLLPLAA